jgi:hypothetical protein
MSLQGFFASMARPAPVTDGNNVKGRGSKYGDLFVMELLNPLQNCAAEGSYFRACNATPGTGIAQSIITTFDATKPILTLYNGGNKQINLDYIRLINTVVGATTTSADLVAIIDTINRYTSGGTALNPSNCLSSAPFASSATVFFGAILAAAASAAKIMGRAKLKVAAAPCWILYDQILMTFGQSPIITPTGITATTATIIPVSTGPVVIDPGHTFCLYVYNTANATTAPSWEVEIGWIER